MVDAESKTKSKRIRHCYPRREVYHRWIHSPEYVYPDHECLVSGKFNYLRCQNIGKLVKDEDIKEMWNYHKQFIIAVIDRENKKICISTKYDKWYMELVNSLPDDYEIFWCLDTIPCFDILTVEKREILCKEHLRTVTSIYTKHILTPFYNVLEGKKVLHTNINDLSNPYRYCDKQFTKEAINKFVKKYRVKKYSWYKETLNPEFKLHNYYPDSWSVLTIELPSVKKILTGTVFTKHQKELFEKRYFYTNYCFGKGIRFKDVERYWNIPCEPSTAKAFFDKRNCYWLDDYDNGCKTWNDFVIRFNQVDKKRYEVYIEEQVKKSNENFLEAQRQAALMLNGSRPVDLWRENNTRQLSTKGVKYRKFVIPFSRNKYGHWIDDYVYAGNNIKFENIQLRLTKDKKLIETSKYASVPYDSAIKLWHKFIIWINSNNVAENPYFSFNNKNIKVGLYNLRFIRYCTKRTDNGKTIYNENGKPILDWLIQIGCHSIWLTDVLDFINYYKLEKDFQTQYVLNPRVKPNINNNK